MYIFAYLDSVNLGFAKNAFQASTGISQAAYAFGAGIFSIAYASIEIPSNIMLRKVGARLWLSRIMITWGIVSACMMFVNGATSFYIVRVLLGVAEEIAALVAWPSSEDRSFSTGAVFDISGGRAVY